MRRAVLLSLATVAAASGTAAAQPKPAAAKVVRACNATTVPLSVGNEWTYESVQVPPDRAMSEAQLKALPPQPKQVVIKVTAIDTKDNVTTVTLSEDLDGRVHTSTITCAPGGGLSIAPNAFWFNGEPGDVIGLEMSELTRKGKSIELAGGKLNAALTEWHDDLTAKWKHIAIGKVFPTLRSGTIELARHVVVLPSETIVTKAGNWKAAKLGIETTTKITIEPAPELPLREIPLLVNLMYLQDGVGVVGVINSAAQYLLVNYQVL